MVYIKTVSGVKFANLLQRAMHAHSIFVRRLLPRGRRMQACYKPRQVPGAPVIAVHATCLYWMYMREF